MSRAGASAISCARQDHRQRARNPGDEWRAYANLSDALKAGALDAHRQTGERYEQDVLNRVARQRGPVARERAGEGAVRNHRGIP